jgi:hypothetical protein
VLSAATTARREAAMREKRILRDFCFGSKKGVSDDRRSWKRWEVKLEERFDVDSLKEWTTEVRGLFWICREREIWLKREEREERKRERETGRVGDAYKGWGGD